MRLLLVHPSSLMCSEIFSRLEPLGLERVVGAAREAGHEVRVVGLQVFSYADLAAELTSFRPQALGISLNYLADVPDAIEISAKTKRTLPGCFVFPGGHSVSFIAEDVLREAGGAVDAVVDRENETAIGALLDGARDGGLGIARGDELFELADAVPRANGPARSLAGLPLPRAANGRLVLAGRRILSGQPGLAGY